MGLFDWLDEIFKTKLRELPGPELKETPWQAQMRDWFMAPFTTGGGPLGDILAGRTFQDPRTSPYWQGLREEMTREEEEGARALRRRSQLAGMLNSSRSMQAESDYRSRMGSRRMELLGSLYEQERARDNPYTRLAAALPVAETMLGYMPWYQPQYIQDPSGFMNFMSLVGAAHSLARLITPQRFMPKQPDNSGMSWSLGIPGIGGIGGSM